MLSKNSIPFLCALAYPLHFLYLLALREGILGVCWDHSTSEGKADNAGGISRIIYPTVNGNVDKIERTQIPAINETIKDSPELTQAPHQFCLLLERDKQ